MPEKSRANICDAATALAHATSAALVGERLKVLVADDSTSILQLLSVILKQDYDVLTAENGHETLLHYATFGPDVIILDIHMPGPDGLEVLDRIRNDHKDPDTYIIVLTAEEDAAVKPKALTGGANDYLQKPFQRAELLARVEVAARQIRLMRQLRVLLARASRELAMVASLQERLLPRVMPHLPGLSADHLYLPSGMASGDYYDLILLPNGRLRVVMADVSGHGARAAFLMAIVRSLFRASRHADFSLAQVMPLINAHLTEIIADEADFVTCFAADLDIANGSLDYINAGQCPPLLFAPRETTPRRLDPQAPLLGFFEADFPLLTAAFPPGAALFCYTDGIYEWELPSPDAPAPEIVCHAPGLDPHPAPARQGRRRRNFLGLGRFIELTELIARAHAAEETAAGLGVGGETRPSFLTRLEDELANLAGGTPYYRDDVTALYLCHEHVARDPHAGEGTDHGESSACGQQGEENA